ncbi:hypothetical protein [Fontivita pretiosa]|uniref:hypothetical protein n=1 Tax=Fontivita pretiosa TaxID=2989684 RepID=UPI003D16C0CD
MILWNCVMVGIVACCLATMVSAASAPQQWRPNPYVLLDQSLISNVDHLQRCVCQPHRHPQPVVDAEHDQNFQPWLTVIRDPQTRRFRMWYNIPFSPGNAGASSLALIESDDGIHWIRPHKVLDTPPIQFGASVIDEGPSYKDPSTRYKLAWWKDGGLQVAGSPDGVNWKYLAPGPVIRANHDITGIEWDPIRNRYMGFLSVMMKLDPSWDSNRRIPHMSVSDDLIHWRQPWISVRPDPTSPREQGETEFYGLSAILPRGELLVGMVKILRDDLNCEPGLNARDLKDDNRNFAGLGYTVLAWSRDGEHWNRDTEPFLDRNPQPGTWDRAHAWADDQVPVGDEVFIYYGGYALGHKADRFRTRQVGLARMPRDRYVCYAADATPGHLRTAVAPLLADRLTVNAKVDGELRVRVCDPSGKAISGFDFDDCQPVKGDSLAHEVRWKAPLSSLRGQPVQFVFTLRDARIFAFDLADGAAQ